MNAINELLYKAEELLRINYLSLECKFFKMLRSEYYYKNRSKRLERQCRELAREQMRLVSIIDYMNALNKEV